MKFKPHLIYDSFFFQATTMFHRMFCGHGFTLASVTVETGASIRSGTTGSVVLVQAFLVLISMLKYVAMCDNHGYWQGTCGVARATISGRQATRGMCLIFVSDCQVCWAALKKVQCSPLCVRVQCTVCVVLRVHPRAGKTCVAHFS